MTVVSVWPAKERRFILLNARNQFLSIPVVAVHDTLPPSGNCNIPGKRRLQSRFKIEVCAIAQLSLHLPARWRIGGHGGLGQ
jgi:hypothetical protein